jgi:hypothetical protein
MVIDYPDWATQGSVPIFPNAPANWNDASTGDIILPIPTSGHYYLFGWDIAIDSGGTPGFYYIYDLQSERLISVVYLNAGDSKTVQLNGYQPINGVKIDVAGDTNYGVIRYATGP